jgi:hypothetical protein
MGADCSTHDLSHHTSLETILITALLAETGHFHYNSPIEIKVMPNELIST